MTSTLGADRAVFERLLDGADVLVENFRPGVLDRLGYGWEKVAVRWPGLVLASVSGFGQTGPYADRPSYDMVAQAMGGVMSITGHPGGEPARVGSSMGDLAAALFCAIGVVSALYERRVTGVARHVDVSMLDCQVALLENAIVRFGATGVVPGPLGARHPSITPFGVFRAGTTPAWSSRPATTRSSAGWCGRWAARICRRRPFRDQRTALPHEAELEAQLEGVLARRPAERVAGGARCGPGALLPDQRRGRGPGRPPGGGPPDGRHPRRPGTPRPPGGGQPHQAERRCRSRRAPRSAGLGRRPGGDPGGAGAAASQHPFVIVIILAGSTGKPPVRARSGTRCPGRS